jgi:hypothetical protein
MQHVTQSALPSQSPGFFPNKLQEVSDEPDERFHQNISAIEVLPSEMDSSKACQLPLAT